MVQQPACTATINNRLAKEVVQFPDNLLLHIYGPPLDLQQVEQAEAASNINKWLSSKICAKAC
jgi:hypothetical protein